MVGRPLNYGDKWIRCPNATCAKYLRAVRGPSGRCGTCSTPLVGLSTIRVCTEPDCKLEGQNQFYTVLGGDPFHCEFCRNRLTISPGKRAESLEDHQARAWAQTIANEGRVEIAKALTPAAPATAAEPQKPEPAAVVAAAPAAAPETTQEIANDEGEEADDE